MFKTLKVALFLGYKSMLKSNKAVILLMVFVLSLAFINQIFIGAILRGLTQLFETHMTTKALSNIIVDPQEEPTRKNFIQNAGEIEQQIESVPGIIAASRRYSIAGTIGYDKNRDGKIRFVPREIIGIDPKKEKKVTEVYKDIISGEYLEGTEVGEIILGSELAGGYGGFEDFQGLRGAKVHDKITVNYGSGIVREYTVKGIFKTGIDTPDTLAFITAKEAESILSTYNTASQILVKIEQKGTEDIYAEKIKKIAPNLKVRKWTEYAGLIGDVTKAFDIIASVVSGIGLIVVAITIFILIYVNVSSRKRQLGILKAIGIKQNIIILAYVFQSLFYAALGVFIGSALIFYAIKPYLISYPLKLPFGGVSLAIQSDRFLYSIISFFIAAFIAGFIPASRGAKENILKAIWG